jgi:hypothetical protein
MEYGKVLKRAWTMVWRCRALWIFGAILALTTVNGFYFGYGWDRDDPGNRITVKVNERSTIYLPGQGVSIDLTYPTGFSIQFDGREYHSFQELYDEAYAELSAELGTWSIPRDISAVLIAFGVVVAGMIVVGIIGRYVAEAALIGLVNDAQETDEKASLRQGLRRGFSRSAWRLFLIDLVINLPLRLVFLALFLLALSPLLLWTSGSTAAGIFGTVLSTGLLFLGIVLLIFVNAAVSLLMQVIRRACGVEGLGVFASIRRGLAMVRRNLKETGVIWLIWIGIRFAWMVAMVPVMIVIFPITLLFILAGAVLGGVPALMVGSLLLPFLEGPFPWIVGGVVGLPIFILVMIMPLIFLSGWVEVYKSSMWTLAYRELRPAESIELRVVPEVEASSLEAASTA